MNEFILKGRAGIIKKENSIILIMSDFNDMYNLMHFLVNKYKTMLILPLNDRYTVKNIKEFSWVKFSILTSKRTSPFILVLQNNKVILEENCNVFKYNSFDKTVRDLPKLQDNFWMIKKYLITDLDMNILNILTEE